MSEYRNCQVVILLNKNDFIGEVESYVNVGDFLYVINTSEKYLRCLSMTDFRYWVISKENVELVFE